ncbi:MAG: AraC family transcriptional regulator [Oscillospiraceae bacterium]
MSFEIKKYCFIDNPVEQKGRASAEYAHEGIDLFLVAKGSCTLKSKNVSLTVKSGEIVCCAGYSKIDTELSAQLIGINLTGIIPDRYAKEVGTAFVISEIFAPFLPQQLRQIIENYNNLSENYLANISFEILNTISNSDKKAIVASQIVIDAVTLIKKNYAQAYGVEELAESLGISKSHLVREFFKHTGTTPGKYLTNVRIEAVKQLLTQSNMPLSAVASSTGFSGDNYLCKAFKKLTGETPMEYKTRVIASQYLPNQLTLQVSPEMYL